MATYHGTTVDGNSLDLQDAGAVTGLISSTFGEWEIGPTPPLEQGIQPLYFYYAGAPTPLAQMPKSGSGIYTGNFIATLQSGTSTYLLGAPMTLTVNYTTTSKTLSGSIANMNIYNAATGASLGTTNSASVTGTWYDNVFHGSAHLSQTGGTSGINLYPTHSDPFPMSGLFYGANALEMGGATFGTFGLHK